MRRVLHDIWVVLKPVSEVLLALVILVGLVVVPTLGGENVNVKNNLNGFVTSALGGTGGANTGPLVGDQSLFDQETKCVKSWAQDPANNYVGYWPAIGAPEHADNVRSGLQPCADFTGDFNGQNQVFQYPSETTYPNGVGLVVFDGPDAGYLWAGGIVPGSGQYISKFNPSTGAEIWRTNLTNINAATDQWYALGSMALIEDGTLVGAASNWFWKLDRSTGEILAAREQPTVGTPASSQNYDGMTVAPDEQGTLLIKSQTRPAGCSNQTNNAMNSCTSEYGPNPNSDMVAVDPVTLKNLDAIEINQNVTARASTVEHDGKIYVYGNGAKSLVRVIWDPETQTLKQDLSWQPQVLLKGQSGGASPVVMGDWVIANSNAVPSTETPQCIFAANQDDPNDVHHICPWGKSFPVASGATMSEVPATPGIDPEKNLIFVGDWFLKGVYAIQLDQQTGEMKVKWSRPDWWSADYFTMVGPKDERVLISQNIDASTKTVDQPSYNYNETVLFVNEDTGETIAESASNPSTAIGSLINAGYGGRFYTMGNDGTLWIYQVQACKDASINVTPPSTTSCPPVTASSPSASASASPSG